jgi:hypothetical protein
MRMARTRMGTRVCRTGAGLAAGPEGRLGARAFLRGLRWLASRRADSGRIVGDLESTRGPRRGTQIRALLASSDEGLRPRFTQPTRRAHIQLCARVLAGQSPAGVLLLQVQFWRRDPACSLVRVLHLRNFRSSESDSDAHPVRDGAAAAFRAQAMRIRSDLLHDRRAADPLCQWPG